MNKNHYENLSYLHLYHVWAVLLYTGLLYFFLKLVGGLSLTAAKILLSKARIT